MPPLTSMLQVNHHLQLPLSARSVPAEPPRSGTQRARPRLAKFGGLKPVRCGTYSARAFWMRTVVATGMTPVPNI
jgi:hypothetical protein